MAGRTRAAAGSGAPSPAPEPAPSELERLTAGAAERRDQPATPDTREDFERLAERTRTGGAPTAFAFGEAPAPAEFPEPPAKPRTTGAATHTGTDPHGRAIGPAEDHRKAKRDSDGLTAPQAAQRAAQAAEEEQA